MNFKPTQFFASNAKKALTKLIYNFIMLVSGFLSLALVILAGAHSQHTDYITHHPQVASKTADF